MGGRQTLWRHVPVCLLLSASAAHAQLKISEVYYNVNGPTQENQYVELYNPGPSTAHLDGLVLTDEAGSGIEGVFRFPGAGTDYPVAPGGHVLVAVDADNSDGFPPDMSAANWECYAGGADFDNPLVPNLTLVGGNLDLMLAPWGDNVILATGADTNAPIDTTTIVDGMNFANGGGELAMLSASASDSDPSPVASVGEALCRCPDAADSDTSSAADFTSQSISPGAWNGCGTGIPSVVISDRTVLEGRAGTTQALFAVALSQPATNTVSVTYATANGTAVAGSDYTGISSTVLTFAMGVVSQNVSVTVLGDTDFEGDEVFYVNLGSPVACVIVDGQGIGTIKEDDHRLTRIARGTGVVQNTWLTVSGAVYRFQCTTSSMSSVWTTLGTDLTATGGAASADDPVAAGVTQRFYRVLRVD